MIDDELLADVLRERERHTPDVEPIVARYEVGTGSRRRSGRRWVVLAAAAAAVVAVVVGAVLVRVDDQSRPIAPFPQPAPDSSARPIFPVTVTDLPAGWVIDGWNIDSGVGATVRVTGPGPGDGAIGDGISVSVSAQQGSTSLYQESAPEVVGGSPATLYTAQVLHSDLACYLLAWRPPNAQWIEVAACEPAITPDRLLAFAEGIVAEPGPLPGFRIDGLPDGYIPETWRRQSGDLREMVACTNADGDCLSVGIAAGTLQDSIAMTALGPPEDFADRQVRFSTDRTVLAWQFDEGHYAYVSQGLQPLPPDLLAELVDGISTD